MRVVRCRKCKQRFHLLPNDKLLVCLKCLPD